MRHYRFTALGLALAMVLGACGPDEQDFSAPGTDETPVAEQVPMNGSENGEDEIPEAETFESPLVEENNVITAAPTGLISSTNPQERSRQVQRNLDATRDDNGDPFGILPVEVSRSQRQAETVTRQVTGAPAPGAQATGAGAGTPAAGARNGQPAAATDGITAGPPLPPLTGQMANPLPAVDAQEFAIPRLRPARSIEFDALDEEELAILEGPREADPPQDVVTEPPPPAIDLAQGTQVTGVMQVGGDIQIILQTPGSAFSRYVRVGDTVANGEVRVVRVERLQGEPVVILEQNGVEVARGVGEPGIVPENNNMANSNLISRR
ncbi:hypothetical protein NEA10_09290 [Phormidium yuhuli AB48]|uniref:Pilus assembly protein PilP n=1 Tax=Phormidium yuhuli AB48 TaxID=2940671 RepID=A0ABY5AVP8_9CYAN|nr:hypothetical protein [Phormidium yuhuli]USR92888.1 hypothetical protein NEA10_09290 [Phormidium yuhuli AB48]